RRPHRPPPPVAPLDPIPADCARLSACDTERSDAPVIREHDRGHRLEEAPSPLAAVAAAMAPGAPAAAPDAIRLEPDGKAPLQHFRIGEARVGHVRLHHARAVEIRARAGAA